MAIKEGIVCKLKNDDSKCSDVIESRQDCESLQKDLDSLHGWSENCHLKFNISLRLQVEQQLT